MQHNPKSWHRSGCLPLHTACCHLSQPGREAWVKMKLQLSCSAGSRVQQQMALWLCCMWLNAIKTKNEQDAARRQAPKEHVNGWRAILPANQNQQQSLWLWQGSWRAPWQYLCGLVCCKRPLCPEKPYTRDKEASRHQQHGLLQAHLVCQHRDTCTGTDTASDLSCQHRQAAAKTRSVQPARHLLTQSHTAMPWSKLLWSASAATSSALTTQILMSGPGARHRSSQRGAH